MASLVFRNNSGSGSSAFTLTSLGFSDIEGMGETYDATHEYESVDERPLRVDPRIFQRFELHSGLTPAGFWSDWLGGRTRSDVWNFPEEIREIYGTDRVETIPYNSFGEHVLDWAPLVLAMQWAGPLATTIALGAGWGRWAVGAAIAARKLEKDYHITAVEAEPQHFAWLERHIRDNDIDPQKARLLHAAAGAQSGYCWFQTGDPAGWYGQQIVDSVAPPKEDYFRQLTAERVVTRFEKGRPIRSWQPKRDGERNEALDTFVYAHAALHGLISMGMRLNEEAEGRVCAPLQPARTAIRSAWMG